MDAILSHSFAQVYKYEHADGIGRPWDIVIQGFIKAVFMSIIPVIICAGILYLMVNHIHVC